MKENCYKHKVQYYETDQMQIVHHSNYIRWFEEARGDLLEKLGIGYATMEEKGIIIPVLEAQCQYKVMVKYPDEVYIIPKVVAFNGIKMTVEYEIIDVKTEELRATGKSVHCFLNTKYQPMSLKKYHKELYDILEKLIEK